MKRTHLLTAAAMLVLSGCSESPAAPGYPIGSGTPPDPIIITGIISADSSISPAGVSLRLDTGELVRLVGSEAQRLANLDGAGVQLRGDWSSPVSPPYDSDLSLESIRPSFAVADFLVLAVGGRPAMDGLLGEADGQYFLTLASGAVLWLNAVPSAFEAGLGLRVWVTGSMEDPPLEFGVIY
jgi:hypothetical protein